MPDQLLQLDRHLFYFINNELSNPFFDWLMPLLRNARFWIPLYVFTVVFCIYKFKKTGIVIIATLAITAGIADFTSASVIKPAIKRVRPCRDAVTSSTDIERVPCGTGYSFPSTHATDHFAIASFLSLVFTTRWRKIWWVAMLWAASICFAQVYVSVHYPIDVIGGALYGMLIGFAMALLFKKLQPNFYK
ncbi:phosphatase PAP2 family protein [Mucilaginibacter hurinus]|uniref:Phosphatase PAP2 family protein n=1 Tax=Mucilaginibacter hurinus TaxID=2201324 RepID=A0A367GKL8_9SPHI|nr:phosphatase PAP2 family protein [Mucilaginibacter hurinus]RCH54024.1 phosphatase PAP2 family protein [Mucilaginibacter hurinus]